MFTPPVQDTRAQLLAHIKRAPRTVDELAKLLGITRNAVRNQLGELQALGWVERVGSRPSSRRPALVYGPTAQLAMDESRAYAPVLAELLQVLGARLDQDAMLEAMRAVGTRMAAAHPRPAGSRSERFRVARDVLHALGATTDLVVEDGQYRLEGCACPLSVAVRADPRVCEAVRTMLSGLIGEELTEACHRGDQPRCTFTLAS